jgi:hypothetical protein
LLWCGAPLDETATAAISLWDVFEGGARRSSATILDEHGVQSNVVLDVRHERIWTSGRSGNSYPREVHIDGPAADLTLAFTAMLDKPEFEPNQQGLAACQGLCTMTGRYRGAPIDGHVIVEMVRNVSG